MKAGTLLVTPSIPFYGLPAAPGWAHPGWQWHRGWPACSVSPGSHAAGSTCPRGCVCAFGYTWVQREWGGGWVPLRLNLILRGQRWLRTTYPYLREFYLRTCGPLHTGTLLFPISGIPPLKDSDPMTPPDPGSSCLTLRIPSRAAGSCTVPALARQLPRAAAAPGPPCRGRGQRAGRQGSVDSRQQRAPRPRCRHTGAQRRPARRLCSG